MKKIILGICLSFLAGNINAQETEKVSKNDLVIDPILLIAVPVINVSYERIINQNMGVGINGFFTLNDVDDIQQISPYFRYYLGRRYASGFFLEGFIPVTSDLTSRYELRPDPVTLDTYYQYTGEEKRTTVGIGFGIGGKWAIKNRLILEASGGIARRIINEQNPYDGSSLTGKVMLGVGYRF